MAAEATIRKMKKFLKIRRRERKRVQRLIEQDFDMPQLKIANTGPINFDAINFNRDQNNNGLNDLINELSLKNFNAINLFDNDSVSSTS